LTFSAQVPACGVNKLEMVSKTPADRISMVCSE